MKKRRSSVVSTLLFLIFLGSVPRSAQALPFPGRTPANKLTASDAADNDFLGSSVAISGTRAVFGGAGEDGAGTDRGAAYVFEIPLHHPDIRIGSGPFSSTGDNIHSNSAAGQTLALTSRQLAPVSGFLIVTNDGDTGDNYTIRAGPGTGNFAVRYLRRSGSTESNLTAALIAGTHLERNVVPDEPGRVVRAEITPSPRLKRQVKGKVRITRTSFLTRMTTVSGLPTFKRDTAAISVKTR